MKIKYLGTGNMGGSQKNTAFVIDNHVLMDIGSGTLNSLRDSGLDTGDIDTLIITHWHVDHFGDMTNYLIRFFIRHALAKDDKKVTVIGPRGTRQKIKDQVAFFHGEEEMKNLFAGIEGRMSFVDLDWGKTWQGNGVKIEAFPVNHADSVSNGYLIEKNNKRFSFSGDTAMCDNLIKYLDNSDVAIWEAVSKDGLRPGHMNLVEIEQVAKDYPNKNFYLVHRGDFETKSVCPNIYFPTDGEEVEV